MMYKTYFENAVISLALGYFVYYKWRSGPAKWVWIAGPFLFVREAVSYWHEQYSVFAYHSVLTVEPGRPWPDLRFAPDGFRLYIHSNPFLLWGGLDPLERIQIYLFRLGHPQRLEGCFKGRRIRRGPLAQPSLRFALPTWGHIVEPNEIDILTLTVLCNFEKIDQAQESRLARQSGSDVRKTDGLD